MGKVLQLQVSKEGGAGYIEGMGKCLACGAEVRQVCPLEAPYFTECPTCHCEKMVFKYPVERDMNHWECACGNYHFLVTPDGIYCPNCGNWQNGF